VKDACDWWALIVAMVRDVGFPVFVSVWLLVRFERAMGDLEKRVDRAIEAVATCGIERRRPGRAD
jgi:hypothetical protein